MTIQSDRIDHLEHPQVVCGPKLWYHLKTIDHFLLKEGNNNYRTVTSHHLQLQELFWTKHKSVIYQIVRNEILYKYVLYEISVISHLG